eukprot:4851304-Prymnesium_polylepis.2
MNPPKAQINQAPGVRHEIATQAATDKSLVQHVWFRIPGTNVGQVLDVVIIGEVWDAEGVPLCLRKGFLALRPERVRQLLVGEFRAPYRLLSGDRPA